MDMKKILLLALGHLSCDANSGAVSALLPYLAAAYHFDYQTCGSLTFAFSCMSSFVQPIFGLLADKKSCRLYIPLGILLAGIGFALVGFSESYLGIVMSLMLCGIGVAVFHPEGARYANLVSGTHKGIGVSIFSVGGNSGFAVGPLLTALFVGGITLPNGIQAGGYGLHGTAVFAVIAICMAFLLYWNFVRQNPVHPQASSSKAKSRHTAASVNDWRAFCSLSVCIITRSAAFFGFGTFLPLYWQHNFRMSVEIGNIVLAGFCVFGVFGNLLGGYLTDRIGPVQTVRLGHCTAFPFMLAFIIQSNPYTAALLLIPVALGVYLSFSSMVLLGQSYLAKNMGFASGVTLGIAVSVGGMFMPIIGWIADHYGGLHTAMAAIAVAVALSALSSFALKKPLRIA